MADAPPPERQHTGLPGDLDADAMGEVEISDPDPAPPTPLVVSPSSGIPRDVAAEWHGYLLAGAGLPLPKCVTASDDMSRPAYTTIKSAEYIDDPAALDAKADLMIKMWTAASFPLVYAGAGISTSSGIWDYASNAKGSAVQPQKRALTHSFIVSLKPTPAHRVITAMEKRGLVWG